MTDASNNVTRYVYNTENGLTDIYDANNNHTQFTYDNTNLINSTTFPSTYYESYASITAGYI